MQKTVLVILDGWGYRKETKGNAITPKTAPFFFSLLKKYPWTLLEACGESVGLPKGTIGSSEVGHLTIGAGRVIKQDLVRINEDIASRKFFKNKELKKALAYAKKENRKVHIIGLVSDGGVHSHIHHMHALLKACSSCPNVYVHAITDGRDVSPTSAREYLVTLKNAKIATLIGRYYAMDRDKRWKREQKAFDLLTKGKGKSFSSFSDAIKMSYANKKTDEFIEPVVLNKGGIIEKGDVVLFANFRPDRMRQLTELFEKARKYNIITMTQYDEKRNIPALYPLTPVKNTLGEQISRKGLKQLRIAETEKYAHVTYFFNGMREKPFAGEKRILVPSPKVSTYDKKPEMAAREITDAFLREFREFDFVLVNFANADMVGHTGNLFATKKAVSVVDGCLRRIYDACVSNGHVLLITADHGNAEEKASGVCTSHTRNRVPLIVTTRARKNPTMKTLSDVSPMIIH